MMRIGGQAVLGGVDEGYDRGMGLCMLVGMATI